MSGPKKLPRGKMNDWVRTAGAVGDPSMGELDDFNLKGGTVQDESVTYCDGDPNESLPVKRQPGSEP